MAQAKSGQTKTGSAESAGGTAGDGGSDPVTIKKYANRRLYNTSTSSYVTLDHLSQMIREGIDFAVFDAKTGEDITRSVLTQIIVEEEAKNGQNLLPISFLRSLIGYYGDNMHRMMLPQYLDLSIRSFSENQEKMQSYMQDAFGSVFPFGQLEEIGKQNMAMFEKTMQMFSPFPDASDQKVEQAEDRVKELERRLAEAQAELDAIKGKS
jgi:polyhydroxyalkanoate synthesis repressor PhaR